MDMNFVGYVYKITDNIEIVLNFKEEEMMIVKLKKEKNLIFSKKNI